MHTVLRFNPVVLQAHADRLTDLRGELLEALLPAAVLDDSLQQLVRAHRVARMLLARAARLGLRLLLLCVLCIACANTPQYPILEYPRRARGSVQHAPNWRFPSFLYTPPSSQSS